MDRRTHKCVLNPHQTRARPHRRELHDKELVPSLGKRLRPLLLRRHGVNFSKPAHLAGAPHASHPRRHCEYAALHCEDACGRPVASVRLAADPARARCPPESSLAADLLSFSLSRAFSPQHRHSRPQQLGRARPRAANAPLALALARFSPRALRSRLLSTAMPPKRATSASRPAGCASRCELRQCGAAASTSIVPAPRPSDRRRLNSPLDSLCSGTAVSPFPHTPLSGSRASASAGRAPPRPRPSAPPTPAAAAPTRQRSQTSKTSERRRRAPRTTSPSSSRRGRTHVCCGSPHGPSHSSKLGFTLSTPRPSSPVDRGPTPEQKWRQPQTSSYPSHYPSLLARTHAQELLSWYDRVHRRLPWRESPSARLAASPAAGVTWAQATREGPPQGLAREDFAYGVWVSEVMLQQTQARRRRGAGRGLRTTCLWGGRWSPALRGAESPEPLSPAAPASRAPQSPRSASGGPRVRLLPALGGPLAHRRRPRRRHAGGGAGLHGGRSALLNAAVARVSLSSIMLPP